MKFFKYFLIFIIVPLKFIAHEHGTQHLLFIENKGQWESNIKYKADIKSGAIFLEKTKLTVHIRKLEGTHYNTQTDSNKTRGHVYQIEFLGANPNPIFKAEDKADEYFNYFLGANPTKWKGGCLAYEEIIYKNIYPFIDLKINSSNFQPKYTFVIHKGGRPSDIMMKYHGIDQMKLLNNGDISYTTALGDIKDEKPISYKFLEGVIEPIQSEFLLNKNIVRFKLSDTVLKLNETLEIDPQMVFSAYTGSTADNFGASATYDQAGNLYGTGLVFSAGYVTTTGAYDATFNGASDVSITKWSPSGNARVYATYIGGTSYDVPHSLVVDANDRLILLATTGSTNYPTTTGAYDNSFNGGPALPFGAFNGMGIEYPNGADIAITKFNTAGTALVASTYYGGNGSDGVGNSLSSSLIVNYGDNLRGEVETDSFGNIYVASLSTSTNLPTLANSFKNTNSGGYDGILAKFNTNLTTLSSFTYVGGSNNDALYDLCFDQLGNVIATGGTMSTNIGTTTGVINPTYSGNIDGMIVSYNSNFSIQRFSTYYGTSDYDQVYFVESDKSGNIYLFGQTNHSSTNYFLFNATFSNPHQGQFVSVLNSLATAKIRSTMFGRGNQDPDISPTAFLVDYCDKIFLTGWGSNLGGSNTFSLSTTGLPTTANAIQTTSNGNGFYMLILEGNLSAINYGSFFGGIGTQGREHVDGGTSRFDKNGIIYQAVCAGCGGQNNFPIYPNAASVVSGTNGNAPNGNCNLGVFKFDFGLPVTANFTFSPKCAPAIIPFVNISHTVSNNSKFLWTFSHGVTDTAKNPTITFPNPGIFTARLIITDSTSCNFADTLIKTVIILGTTPDTLSNKIICPGSAVKIGFSGITDTGMTKKWSPTSTLDDTTILSPFASPTVTTTYRLIISKTGCTDTFYQKVIVDTPNTLVIKGDSLACQNSVFKYTTTKYTGGSYDWYPKSILVSSNRDTANFNFTTFPTTISVSYTNSNGCVTSKSLIVKQGVPTLNLTADTIACKGDIVSIRKQFTPSGGTFIFNPPGVVIANLLDTVRIKVDSNLRFITTYSLSPSCTIKDTINFLLINKKLNWQTDSIICKNTVATATAVKDSSYSILWTPSSDLISAQGSSPASFNLNNTEKYIGVRVQHLSKPSCIYRDSIKIRFLENLIKLKADTIICGDTSVKVFTGKVPGASYNWQPVINKINQTDSSATFNIGGSTTIYLTITDNNGCVSSDSIRIKAIKSLINTWGDTIICADYPTTLHTTLMTGATYQWLPAPAIVSGATTPNPIVSTPIPQWYYVHIQDTNGCYFIDSALVNILDSTFYAKANFSATNNCQNLPITFTNSSYTLGSNPAYLWDFNGDGSSSLLNPVFSFTTPGIKSIRLIVRDSSTCNIIDTIIKSILVLGNGKRNLPSIDACQLDTLQIGLIGVVDPTSTVFWTPNTFMLNNTSFSPRVFPSDTTTYTCFISKGACADTLIQKVNINKIKPLDIQGSTIACINSELLFTSTPYSQGTYTWTPFSSISYENRDSVKMLITSSNFKIKLRYLSENGCVSKDSLTVMLVNTNFNLQMDSIGCKNEKLTIKHIPSPNGGVFSYVPNSDIIKLTDTTAELTVDSTKNLSILYFIHNQCQHTKTINFKLLRDAVNWKYDSIVCKDFSITALANKTARWNLNWAPTSLLLSTQNISPAQFGPFTQDEKIYINSQIINRPSCQFSDTGQVRLVDNLVKMRGRTRVCKDSFVKISVDTIPGATYIWEPLHAAINIQGNEATFNADSSRFYFVNIYYKNTCIIRDSFFITVLSPNVKLTADSIVCPNDQVLLTATPLAGATYLWSNGATNSSTTVQVATSSMYYVTVVDTNLCRQVDSISVLTLDLSQFFLLNPFDTLNCKFDSLRLSTSKLPGIIYNWIPNNVIQRGQGTNSIVGFIDTSQWIYVTANILNKNCEIKDSIRIYKDTLYLKLSGSIEICKGDTLSVLANYEPSFIYIWLPPNWITNLDTLVQYQVTDSFDVYCQAISNLFTKCEYKDTFKADYNRWLDNLTVTATPQKIDYGKTTQLNASASNIIDFYWTPAKTLTNQYIPSPSAKPDTTTTYYVTVESPLGCRGSDSVTVIVVYEVCDEPEVFLPSGFTPNRDTKNDYLFIRGDNITKSNLKIYDRWGQKVFETNSQKIGWDGTFNGNELEPGVFAYYLYVECIGGATYSKKGNLTLIK